MAQTANQPRSLQEEIGKRDAFRIPEQEVYLNLVRTQAVLAAAFGKLFKAFGLSDAQYNALRIVGGAGAGGIRSESVGARMVARDPDTTRLLDRLEKAGFVDRCRAADDRRCVVITINDDGRRLLRKLKPKVEALHREQLGHLPRRQLALLNELLFSARHR